MNFSTTINNDASLQIHQNSGLTQVEPQLPLDIHLYEALKERLLDEDFHFYVTDGKEKQKEAILGYLGEGGSKKAFMISKDRALILPNMDVDSTKCIAERWERMVLEEVKMSKILNRLGLLSPMSEQVQVSLTESSEDVIPAYISENFHSLGKTKGLFIIDNKNPRGTSWKREKDFLFKSDEERLDEKNWEAVINPLLTDIEKICLNNIPIGRDSINIAVVKKLLEDDVCQYELRYFGFDFSSKNYHLDIPEIQEGPLTIDFDKSKQLLDYILDNVFFSEFGRRYDFGEQRSELRSLKDRLVEKYSKKIEAKFS